jgi:alkylated DNA nucleotide flippase Atl1
VNAKQAWKSYYEMVELAEVGKEMEPTEEAAASWDRIVSSLRRIAVAATEAEARKEETED